MSFDLFYKEVVQPGIGGYYDAHVVSCSRKGICGYAEGDIRYQKVPGSTSGEIARFPSEVLEGSLRQYFNDRRHAPTPTTGTGVLGDASGHPFNPNARDEIRLTIGLGAVVSPNRIPTLAVTLLTWGNAVGRCDLSYRDGVLSGTVDAWDTLFAISLTPKSVPR